MAFIGSAQFTLGAGGGLNVSTLVGDNSALDRKTSFYLGVTPRYQFTKRLALLADIEYSVKGYHWDAFNQSRIKNRFNFLDISPELEVRIFRDVALGFGFYTGVKISDQIKVGDDSWTNNSSNSKTDFDYGLVASLRIKVEEVAITLSFQRGFQALAEVYAFPNPAYLPPIRLPNQYNQTLQIGLGYYFKFKNQNLQTRMKI